jgi:hypothetical protein
MKYLCLLLTLGWLLLPTTAYAKISNTNDLIAAMQKKYGKSTDYADYTDSDQS